MIRDLPSPIVKKIDRFYWLSRRVLFRIKKKITGNTRPTSYPYVSGDSFRAIADHLHDETSQLNPADVKLGDTVFVSHPLLRTFLQTLHKQIKYPYVLIEHNGDDKVDKSIADLLDDKIIKFYAQDVTYAHEKIVPIPIGIENFHFHVNGVMSFFDSLRKKIEKKPPVKKNRIFFCFGVNTNPAERGPAKEYFLTHPSMDTISGMISSTLHVKEFLIKYKFVASPPGNAIESCRTWEALYIKTVPIVKQFPSFDHFVKIGLPMWVVKDWKELEGITEDDLAKKYDEFMKNANWEPLHMDYWIKNIKKDQEEARKSAL